MISATIPILPKTLSQLRKRDGRVVNYDASRIERAIRRCFIDCEAEPTLGYDKLVEMTSNLVRSRLNGVIPSVEMVQDAVETVLLSAGEVEAARHYIRYRDERTRQRQDRPVSKDIRAAFQSSKQYFPQVIQEVQFYDKYSRFDYARGRRETWEETVIERGVPFLRELVGDRPIPEHIFPIIEREVLQMRVIPSMRLLAMAGAAGRRNNVSLYNCAFLPVKDIDCFVEAMSISMAGCGVGFSVEEKHVRNLPRIRKQTGKPASFFEIQDSQEGWEEALRFGLQTWFDGGDANFDFSHVRPAGAVLRTKGGRASGPEPLKRLLDFARAKLLAKQGGFLTTLDAHDIMCAVGGAAVAGGTRRTAMLSAFDADDRGMLHCKDGDLMAQQQRWNANNSAVWATKRSQVEVMEQLIDMHKGERGEPGILSRYALNFTIPERRLATIGALDDVGINPCGEIWLKPFQFCNLSAVICREDDNIATLTEKVEVAAWIGTIQSLATNFPNLRSEWRTNCEEERLLGVDLNGQMDCSAVRDPETMAFLRHRAVTANLNLAQELGINRSAAVTCVKPSGNSSTLLGCSSGLHARYAEFYVRRLRLSVHSPVFLVLRDAGVPLSPENGQSHADATTWVASFPIKSPPGAITRHDLSALQQLDHWKLNKVHYTEHNPSITVYYKPEELLDICSWVWRNQEILGGISFLPVNDAKYDQMPYEEITEEEYNRMTEAFPAEIDFSKLLRYEQEDYTTVAGEVSCAGGVCEIGG